MKEVPVDHRDDVAWCSHACLEVVIIRIQKYRSKLPLTQDVDLELLEATQPMMVNFSDTWATLF